MQRLFQILICAIIGTLTGVLIWGAIVKGILYALDLQHGEGFAHIPSPFLGWLSLIIGGMNGTFIGAVLGVFGAVRIFRGALIALAATLAVILGYYIVIDPGITLLVWSSSMAALGNLAVVAVILALPSLPIGGITAFIYSKIIGSVN